MIRLKGLVLIINCLLPVGVIAGVLLFFVAVWTVLEAELAPPVEQLIVDAANLADHARNAARSVEAAAVVVRGEAATVQEAASAMIEPMNSFRISIPSFNVPILEVGRCRVNLNVPKAFNIGSCFRTANVLAGIGNEINSGLQAAFAGPRAQFDKISGSIGRARDEIARLAPLADAFRNQAREFEARAAELGRARERITTSLGRIVSIATWVLAGLLAWAALGYFLWVHERLAVGWHMLRHGARP